MPDPRVQLTQPGRYALHDLLRAYAAELAATEDGPDACHAALTRLFDHTSPRPAT